MKVSLRASWMSRYSVAGVASAMLLMCAGALYAQDGEPLGALRHGPLVVWYLAASTRPPQSNLNAVAALHNATPLNYSEKTTGNFGQNASTFGQNAASYGVDADSPHHQHAVDTTGSERDDREAQRHRVSAEGLEQLRPECGGVRYEREQLRAERQHRGAERWELWHDGKQLRNGGEQCGAECFGLWTLRMAVARLRKRQIPERPTQQQGPLRNAQAEQVKEGLREAFPDLQMRFLAVDPDQLKARLMAARGTADYPDVLLGTLAGRVVEWHGHRVWARHAAAGGLLSERRHR